MENKAFDLVSLGEIMLRLSTPSNERLQRGDIFEKRAGGSELNVASGVSLLGLRTGIISKLPDNEMGSYIKNRTRFVGVSDDYLIYDKSPDARLGIYYYENGAAPRKPAIVYDRKASSMTRICLEDIPKEAYASTRCFHTSGITLALSEDTRNFATEMVRRFKAAGALISFDVNYRANLWDEETARKAVLELLPYVDILFVSEETSRRMLQKDGELNEIMRSYCTDYGVKIVATTQRKVKSPRRHDFASIIYDHKHKLFVTEKAYEDIDVVDRIGSGDAYVAGVLFGMLAYNDVNKALRFGNATAAVKNTIPGDLPSSDYKEISRIIEVHNATGYINELNR